ncbi:MAG: A24 family peptidase [Roseiflexaceae bacterium]
MDTTLIVVAILGLIWGSLLNIVVIRLPREKNLGGWPRCTRCGKPLAWWQILPVIGWVIQGGRARCCGKPLHWMSLVVELSTALTMALLYLMFGLGISFVYFALITSTLIIIAAIDWLHRWIYNVVVWGGTLIALLGSIVVSSHGLLNSFLGLLTAGFVFVLFFILARILFPSHGAPFGLGDVYLALLLGATFGFGEIGAALMSGMLIAGIYSVGVIGLRALKQPTPTYISYGTFLCMGAIIYLLTGLIS